MQKLNKQIDQSKKNQICGKGCDFRIRSFLKFFLVVITFTFGILPALKASELQIVKDGKPNVVIIINRAAKPCVKKAAEELRLHIQKISGAELPIVELNSSKHNSSKMFAGKPLIALGDTPFARKAGIRSNKFPDDGFAIRCKGNRLIIAGKDGKRYSDNYREGATDSAGTLYGVYSFLEDLGVRWFYPEFYEVGTIIPKMNTISIKEQNREDSPRFHYRDIGGTNQDCLDYKWRRRLKAGGTCNIWSTKHDVSIELSKFFHSNGKKSFQVDLSLPEVQDKMAEMAEARFRSNRDEGDKYFLILPLDGGACWDAPSEWILGSIEKLAWRMLKKYPQYKFVHCPYAGFVEPPARVRNLPPNMVLLIALNRISLLDKNKAKASYQMIARWQEFKPAAIYFCRYNNSLWKMNPVFFPHLISDDIKTLTKMSAKGYAPFDGEMNFNGRLSSKVAWWEYPNEYFTAKLLWNPDADIDALIKDFCDKMFGPASSEMETFIDVCEKAYADPAQRDFFNVETIEKLERLIALAKDKVKGQKEFETKVEFFSKNIEPFRALKMKLLGSSSLPTHADNQLMAYFPFDEGQGILTKDTVGNRQGAVKNAKWVDGIKGKALCFTDNASVKINPYISLADSDYSFEAWIKPKSLDSMVGLQYIFGPECYQRQMLAVEYFDPTPDNGVAGKLVLKHRIWDKNYDTSNIELKSSVLEFKPGKWHHVVGTFSKKSGMTIYLDGKIVGIDTFKRTPSKMALWYIGSSGKNSKRNSRGFQGTIDEVKIYGRELSYGEVKNAARMPDKKLNDKSNAE